MGIDVGKHGVIEFLDPAQIDHPACHPVGENEQVPLHGLAGSQLVDDLGEERLVVRHIFGVGDRDSRVLLEPGKGRVRVLDWVHVRRPVRDHQFFLAAGQIRARARLRRLLSARRAEHRQHPRAGAKESGGTCSLE